MSAEMLKRGLTLGRIEVICENKKIRIANMTKLMQWLCFVGLTFTAWFSLLADVLPIRLSKSAKEVVFPVRKFGSFKYMYRLKLNNKGCLVSIN